MTDEQLLRYARHLLLDDIGVQGQQALLRSHALVVGAGGLGSPVALYLGSAGVGRLTVVDDDTVDTTNLQRQIAHDLSRVGLPKALSVQASVAAINPDVQVRPVLQRADASLLQRLVAEADVVLDCSDNFATRQAVNAACVAHGTPLVWGAAVGWDAQLSVWQPGPPPAQAAGPEGHADARPFAQPAPAGHHAGTAPCYACLFPPEAGHRDVACATLGVLAPLVGIVGSLQAAEAIKLLVGAGQSLAGQLLMLDARTMDWTRIGVARRADCSVCSASHPAPTA